MKAIINLLQKTSLEALIFNSIMANDEMGVGEINEAMHEAERIVSEWILMNDVKVFSEEDMDLMHEIGFVICNN
jgi:hypothetical protein